METIQEVRQRLAELKAEADSISAIAGDLTDEQDARLQEILEEAPRLRVREASLEASRDVERAFAKVDPQDVVITGGRPRSEDDPKAGWKHYGEFCLAVHKAAAPGGQAVVDDRLRIGAAPTTYGSEGVGADGGYLVPPDFANRITDYSLEGDALLPMTDNIPVSGNAMRFPADESTPWGSTGMHAYWEAEGAQATQSKPALKGKDLRLSKLFSLVPMTDELLADANAAGAYVERKTGQSIRWKTNDSLINGTGAGQPLGIANAGALVTQAKESGQSADTIVAANVAKMYARCLNPGRAIWHINPDAFAQLVVMTISDQPVWTAPRDGMVSAPAGFLMGRPIRLDDSCQTLGDLGDIYLADWMSYVSISKAAEIAQSIHLWFDYDQTAFRATFRVDGQPWAGSAVTPPNSAVTRSGFVALAARA